METRSIISAGQSRSLVTIDTDARLAPASSRLSSPASREPAGAITPIGCGAAWASRSTRKLAAAHTSTASQTAVPRARRGQRR